MSKKLKNNSALDDLQQSLELLMINTEEPFVLVDKAYNIVSFNDQFKKQYLKYFGMEVLKGHCILDYAQNHKVEILKNLYRDIFNGATKEAQLDVSFPDNTKRTYLTKYKPALNENGEIIGAFVSSIDITEQLLLKELQNASDKRFKALIENASEIISMTNKDGNIIYISPSVSRITGYSFEELRDDRYFSKMHPDSKKDSKKILEEALKNPGVPIYRLNHLIHKNGDSIWMEGTVTNLLDDINVQAVVSNFRDITERKKTEERLNQSENNLRVIFDNSEEAFMLLDTDCFIKAFNSKANENYSFALEDLKIGKNILDFIPAGRRDHFESYIKKVLKGETVEYEVNYGSEENKEEKWFHVTMNPIKEGEIVKDICITRRDVTEKLNSQKSMQLSEQLFRALVQHGADLISILDIEGNYKFSSPSSSSILGIAPEELIGKNAFDYIHEDDKQRVFNQFTLLKRKKTIQIAPFRIKNANDNWVWLETIATNMLDDAAVNGIVSNSRDITLNINYNQKLKQNFERYESLAKATSDAIWDHDFEIDKTYIAGNGYRNLFGYNLSNQFSENNFWESKLHPDEKETIINNLKRVTEDPSVAQSELEYRFLKANGSYAHVLDRFFIIRENGKAIRMLGAKQDITKQKIEAQEKEKLINELTQNNADLKQFSYITSHNLRGPIANLLGLSGLLENYDIKDENLKQILAGIKKAAFMFDDIVKDLTKVLNVKDRGSIPQEELIIAAALEKGVVQNEVIIIESGTEIITHFDNAPLVKFNKAYLESIFFNLISNSIKYRSPARKLKIMIQSENNQEEVILKFNDNGLGLDIELYKDRLFRLYQRFHDHAEGKGLGLFLIKSQMEALNGSIDIESEVGVGTTFILKFKK